MYYCVHSAFATLKSYYSTRYPSFLVAGLLILRTFSLLRNFTFATLKSYYSTCYPSF